MTANTVDQFAEVLSSAGETVAGAGNRPITLDDAQTCWFVEQGAVDVFLGAQQDGNDISQLRHVLRAPAGRLVFGVQTTASPLKLVAKGLPDSRLRRIEIAALATMPVDDGLAHQVDLWVSEFGASVARRIEPRPRLDMALEIGDQIDAAADSALSARTGHVVWVSGSEHDAVLYLGTETAQAGGARATPLSSDSWLSMRRDAHLTCESSRELHRQGRLLTALNEFHQIALSAEQLNRQLLLADEVNLRTAQAAQRRQDEESARRSLFAVMGNTRSGDSAGDSDLLSALRVIGKHERIAFTPPPSGLDAEQPALRDIVDASGIRARKVRLSTQDKWWRGDSGALLAFRREDGSPVALLPAMTGRYRIVDPVTGRRKRLDARRADRLDTDAWFFYRRLPPDMPVRGRDLLRFAGSAAVLDLGRFAFVGLLASLLSLVPAVLVAHLVDWALIAGDRSTIAVVVAAFVVLGLVFALLSAFQGMMILRFQGRVGSRLAAALWDRVLRLESSFFKEFTAGDLGVRMAGIQVLRDQATAVATSAVTAAVVLPALPLLLSYNAPLAWTSLGLSMGSLAIITLVGILQIAPQRRRHAAARRITGDLLQFINGISKLRSSGAEQSAFASWARSSRDLHLATLGVNRLDQYLVGYSTAVPALAAAALFSVTIWQGAGQLALGDFVAVYIASMTVYGAISGLGMSFKTVILTIPTFEQIQPILEAVPARSTQGAPHPTLSGAVTLDSVSFRYSESGPVVLDDVTVRASPGEFVALVGESGAGKSTLMRLALGLDEPSSGAVYYDGLDLTNLDRRVRRQIGVVTQDGALLPGTILDNIIGLANNLTIDDAWTAAKQAAVDREIAEMPMGMLTLVGDNAAIFSGGQIQRMRIAAALARRPRILFFDEATSFLDAMSQATVMEAVEELALTRVVIAHRLSTIRNAQRIYVLKAGRVVQVGGFDELSSESGPFRDLVHRQMT